jgi:DNA polymerase-3 subunit gamma/tau
LGQLLGEWTHARWVVSVSSAAGEPSLKEQAEARLRHLRSEAEEHPMVRAVLETFPGARIEAVRELAPLDGAAAGDEPSDTDGEDEG